VRPIVDPTLAKGWPGWGTQLGYAQSTAGQDAAPNFFLLPPGDSRKHSPLIQVNEGLNGATQHAMLHSLLLSKDKFRRLCGWVRIDMRT
jgi:hypothetical protein